MFAGAGTGDVTAVIKDPQGRQNSVEVAMEDKGDGVYRCTYRPTQAGTHTVSITFGGAGIPRSPFSVDIGPGERVEHGQRLKVRRRPHVVMCSASAACVPGACRASGRGLQASGMRVKQAGDIKVDTRNAGSGDLKVLLKGPSE